MHKIVIIDAMSYLRVKLETERPQFLVRGVVNDAIQPGRFLCWVWDGAGAKDARRAIFPGYKQRPPAPSQIYQGLHMLRQLLTHTGAWQARLAGFEGDDLIAALVTKFKPHALPIEIWTTDGDLMALRDQQVSLPMIHQPKVSPELLHLYKITVGDPSDTIPGVKGFGKGSWDKADKAGLRTVMDAVLFRAPWDEKHALAVGIPKGSVTWLQDDKNQDELRLMWRVLQPLPMSDTELNQALRPGKDDPEARTKILTEFMQ